MIARLLLGAYVLAATAMGAMHDSSVATVHLSALNGSGQTGTATLVQKGHDVLVTLTMAGIATGVAEPSHIHPGTCTNLTPAPKYVLTNATDGSTTTTLANVQLSSLVGGHYAINVHDPNHLARYVACGNIP